MPGRRPLRDGCDVEEKSRAPPPRVFLGARRRRVACALLVAVCVLMGAFASSAMGACVLSSPKPLGVLTCRAAVNIPLPTARARGAGALPQRIVSANRAWSAHAAERKERWLALNPQYEFEFFDDAACAAFMLTEFGAGAQQQYLGIRDGPIRGDMFRVHYLYRRGGVWVDIDVVPRLPLAAFGISPDGPVFIPRSSNPGQLNPTVIAAAPSDPTLQAAVAVYQRLRETAYLYTFWSWSCVHILSALRHRGFPVDAAAVERCPSGGNGADCYIAQGDGPDAPALLANRGADYDFVAHRFRP